MTHGSLFSGIGGFELGAQWVDIPTEWSCEIEEYQRSILKKNFPNTTIYGDIKEARNLGYVDIISGGFPCQDVSIAGRGIGITGARSGLWREMFRIIWEVRPRYVLIENSPALLFRGFEQILCDLFKIGYNAEWQCISNSEFGFPHQRERIYIIAYSSKIRFKNSVKNEGEFYSIFGKRPSKEDASYTCSERFYSISDNSNYRAYDRVPSWTHRIESLGNAVNPVIAAYLFNCIKQFNNE